MNTIENSESETDVRGRMWLWVGAAVFLGALALLVGTGPAAAIDDQDDYTVTGLEIWDLAANPDGVVVINGTLLVNPGGVLVVDGITVAFNNTWAGGPVAPSDGTSSLTVLGGLSLQNGAHITSAQPTGCGNGCDYNFRVTTFGGASLVDSQITYATSVVIETDVITISNMVIRNPNYGGIYFTATTLSIIDSSVSGNGWVGIYIDSSSSVVLTLLGSSVDNNADTGIFVNAYSLAMTFASSTADNNAYVGIYVNWMSVAPTLGFASSSVSGSGDTGLFVAGSNGGNLTATFDTMRFNQNALRGIHMGDFLNSVPDDGSAFILLTGSTITRNGMDGFLLSSARGDLLLDIQGTDLSGNDGSNALVGSVSRGLLARVLNSDLSGAAYNGWAAFGVVGFATLSIGSSDISGNGQYGVLLNELYSGGLVTVDGSTLSGNSLAGLGVLYTYSGDVAIAVSDSAIDGSMASAGLYVEAVYDGNLGVSVTNTSLSGNSAMGLAVRYVYGMAWVSITDGLIVGNGVVGLYLDTVDMGGAGPGAWSSIALTNTVLQGNNIGGVYLGYVYNGDLLVALETVTILDHSSFGFYRDYHDGGGPGRWAAYSFANVTVTNTTDGFGIGVGSTNRADVALSFTGTLVLAQNNGWGFYSSQVSGGGVYLRADLTSGDISNNGESGFWVSSFDTNYRGSVEISLPGVTVQNNGGSGFHVFDGDCYAVTAFSVVLSGATFANNAGDGFYVSCVLIQDTLAATVDVSNVIAADNWGHGVYLGGAYEANPARVTGFLPMDRFGASSVYDGQYFYIFGGWGCWVGCLSDEILRFDPVNGTTTVLPSTLPYARGFTSAVWDGSQYAYVFGGATCFIGCEVDEIVRFEPATGNVQVVAYLWWPMLGTSSVWDDTRSVAYIFGGSISGNEPRGEIMIFDPSGPSVGYGGYMPWVYRYFTTAVWDGQYAYIFGGTDGCYWYCWQSDQVVRYDPFFQSTQVVAYGPSYHAATAVWLNGKAYVLGQDYCWWNCAGGDIFSYDPVTNNYMDTGWDLPATGRAWASGGTDGTQIYLFGGTPWYMMNTVIAFQVPTGTPTLTATVQSSQFTDNGCQGFWLGEWYGDDTVSSSMSTYTGNGCGGFHFGGTMPGTASSVTLDQDTVGNNGEDGIWVGHIRGPVSITPATGSDGNGCYGIYVYIVEGGDFTLDLNGLSASNNGCGGVYLQELWWGHLTALLGGGTFDGNGGDGVFLLDGNCFPLGGMALDIVGSSFSFNNGDGFHLGCINGPDLDIALDAHLYEGNWGWALYFDGVAYGSVRVSVTNTQFLGNSGGIHLPDAWNIDSPGEYTIVLTDNVVDAFGSCCQDGLWIGTLSNGWVDGTVTIQRNLVRSHGDDAIWVGGITGCASCWPAATYLRAFTLDISDNIVENNNDDGIHVDSIEAATAMITVDRNTVRNNGGNGFQMDYVGEAGRAYLTITGGTFENNWQNGFSFAYIGDYGGYLSAVVTDVTLANNAGTCCYAGIWIGDPEYGAIDFMLDNVTVTDGYSGIHLDGGSSPLVGTIRDSTVSGGIYGVGSDGYDNGAIQLTMWNSSVSGAAIADIYQWRGTNEQFTLINTPYATRTVYPWADCGVYGNPSCSWILHQWFYHVEVLTGAALNQPAPGVGVSVSENGRPVVTGFTDATGRVSWLLGSEWAYSVPVQMYFTTLVSASNGVVTASASDTIDTNGMTITVLLGGDMDADGVPDLIDNDDDNDGWADTVDAFPEDPAEWLDTDSDGVGDNTDPDDDNDGVVDTEDACATNPAEYLDTDGDGICDYLDADDDNDSVIDANDAFPNDPSEWRDLEGDRVGDAADPDDDGDGVADASDPFPDNAAEWRDTDGDGLGDNADNDDDGDGTLDANDAFPNDAAEWRDLDGDGVGDAADPDDDGDGVTDASDPFPDNAAEWRDTDGDGIGDFADDDDDGDGLLDASDAFPSDANETRDSDGDGTGDNADTDRDGDGIANVPDDFPDSPIEWVDSDGDGLGDNADNDDDGDGVIDASDEFPLNPAESRDSDGDGIGNVADTDDDNDGILDTADAQPLVYNAPPPPAEPDNDSDGVPDAADWDDDNDGWSDEIEALTGTNPRLASSTPDDLDGDLITDYLDPDIDGDQVFNENDAYPLNPNESQSPDKPQIDAMGTLLVPLVILVVLAAVGLVLFLMTSFRRRRPPSESEFDAIPPPGMETGPKPSAPVAPAPSAPPTTIDGVTQEPDKK